VDTDSATFDMSWVIGTSSSISKYTFFFTYINHLLNEATGASIISSPSVKIQKIIHMKPLKTYFVVVFWIFGTASITDTEWNGIPNYFPIT
jgi:hypothetical protein